MQMEDLAVNGTSQLEFRLLKIWHWNRWGQINNLQWFVLFNALSNSWKVSLIIAIIELAHFTQCILPNLPFYPMPTLSYPIVKIYQNDYLADYIIKWLVGLCMKPITTEHRVIERKIKWHWVKKNWVNSHATISETLVYEEWCLIAGPHLLGRLL